MCCTQVQLLTALEAARQDAHAAGEACRAAKVLQHVTASAACTINCTVQCVGCLAQADAASARWDAAEAERAAGGTRRALQATITRLEKHVRDADEALKNAEVMPCAAVCHPRPLPSASLLGSVSCGARSFPPLQQAVARLHAQAREGRAKEAAAAAAAEKDALQQQLVEAQEGLAGAELRASAAEAARERAEVVASLCLLALWLLSLSGSRRCAGPPAGCRVAPVVGLPRAQAQHEQAKGEAAAAKSAEDALKRELLRALEGLAGMERRASEAEAERKKAEVVAPLRLSVLWLLTFSAMLLMRWPSCGPPCGVSCGLTDRAGARGGGKEGGPGGGGDGDGGEGRAAAGAGGGAGGPCWHGAPRPGGGGGARGGRGGRSTMLVYALAACPFQLASRAPAVLRAVVWHQLWARRMRRRERKRLVRQWRQPGP